LSGHEAIRLSGSPTVNRKVLEGVAWYWMQWLAAKEDLEAKIAYRYRIDSSLDKTTWEPIADASENREFREVYGHTIPKRLVRYIRLTTLPHPDLKDHQARPKIAEILVYGAN